MANTLDEKVEPIFQEVLARNPGETEFHQAAREVLESLGPVLVKHPEFASSRIIERICERLDRRGSHRDRKDARADLEMVEKHSRRVAVSVAELEENKIDWDFAQNELYLKK